MTHLRVFNPRQISSSNRLNVAGMEQTMTNLQRLNLNVEMRKKATNKFISIQLIVYRKLHCIQMGIKANYPQKLTILILYGY